MPFLDKIVDGLNLHWQKSSLSFIPAAMVKMYGIAETILQADEITDDETNQVKTVVKRYPATVSNDGDATMIAVDDCYQLIMYHRLEGIINTVKPNTAYGSSAGDQLETANMALVVMAFRNKVKKPAHWLEAALKDALPDKTELTDNNKKHLQTSLFRLGNSSFDKLALLSREYTEIQLNYENLIVFELKYRIESTWKKGCFLEQCTC